MARTLVLILTIVGPLLSFGAACSDERDSVQPGGQAAVTSIAALPRTPSAGTDSATSPANQPRTATPTTTPAASATPRPVRYASGEVVNVEQGILFIDPRTGATALTLSLLMVPV
jgi:hypothetical protein